MAVFTLKIEKIHKLLDTISSFRAGQVLPTLLSPLQYLLSENLMDSTNSYTGTQSIDRAFSILKAVGKASATGVTLTELVSTLSLNRTTIYRILCSLAVHGAVRYDRKKKLYFLGPLSLKMGRDEREVDLRSLMSSALTRIAEQTCDTTFLMLRSGYDAVCIDRRLGSYPVKAMLNDIGARRPLGVGAGSISMLGAMDEKEMHEILRRNSNRVQAHGRSMETTIRLIRASRQLGYCAAQVYGVEGITAVGVPLGSSSEGPIASLSVAAINKRMSKSRQMQIAKILRHEAENVRENLENVLISEY